MSTYEPDDIDTEALLQRVIDIVTNAKAVPLSASVMITRDEVLELLDGAVERLPQELRSARYMLREREEFLEKTEREADEILEAARSQAERMVQRTEIVREAKGTAQRIVDKARDDARRMRHETEDYCDQKLGAFEIVLDRTIKTVQAGREKLRVTPLPPVDDEERLAVADELFGAGAAGFDDDGIYNYEQE